MKKYIIWVVCIILACFATNSAKAQSVKRESKTFIANASKGSKASNDVATPYTWRDNKGNEYPIVLHKYTKGKNMGKWGAYVVRKSEKTGNDYKYYIPNNEEIVNTITKEMGL